MDPRLDGPGRTADDRRDLVDRHVFEEVQDEHLAVPHVEHRERAVQGSGVLSVEPGLPVAEQTVAEPGGSGFGLVSGAMILAQQHLL